MLFYSNPLFNPLVTSFKGVINMSTNQSSIFSPETFLDATTTEESVKRPPLPAGLELQAMIKSLKTRTWQGKKDPTLGGIAADLTIEFDLTAYPDIQKQQGGLDKVTIIDGIMLDLTEGGSIDYSPGKNSRLRRYREATGLNVAGQPFSLRMLEGRMVKARIKHDPYEGEIYDKIESVAKV